MINSKNFSSIEIKGEKSTYPRLNFKHIDSNDLIYFESILPQESIIKEDLSPYNMDWSRKFKGNSSLVLKPKTTEEVSQILKYCNENKLALVPQSGNTGLVGGSVPVHDEIILSLTKLNKIINFNPLENSLYCEAGCNLENLNNYLISKGFQMPLDLGAKGSCLIGGNIATNAGGIHFVQHGSLRSNVKGLKFVLANGEIINCLNSLPKNNTGYDIKQLLIGSEGTLGVITECIIYTPEKLAFNDLALLAINGYENIIKVYETVKENLKTKLSAIEYFDRKCQDIQAKYGRINPMQNEGKNAEYYLIVEIESDDNNNKINLENFLDQLFEKELIIDAVIAQDETQKKKIWEIRETIGEGASRGCLVISYDISLPVNKFNEIIELTRERVGSLAEVIGYGHIGDYNLHLNVRYGKNVKDEGFYKIKELLEPFIYDYLITVNGSISAEHGIGIFKSKYLDRSQSVETIEIMKNIKRLLDPNGILNPYKLFY